MTLAELLTLSRARACYSRAKVSELTGLSEGILSELVLKFHGFQRS